MKKDNVIHLKNLGSAKTEYVYDEPNKNLLECFENQFPHRQYVTQFVFTEFTSLCPKTGQPDFAHITLEYAADKYCIETKSLKIYYLAYRNKGAFMETITNQILEDCWDACNPHWMRITAKFNARGGTFINVIAEQKRHETN
jgi:7-cyano-7-deazaguanine reductase